MLVQFVDNKGEIKQKEGFRDSFGTSFLWKGILYLSFIKSPFLCRLGDLYPGGLYYFLTF